jgi:hypothetical protein
MEPFEGSAEKASGACRREAPSLARLLPLVCWFVACTSQVSDLPARSESELDAGFANDSTAASTFTRDVFPIVKETCALAGCHLTGLAINHFTDFSTEMKTYMRWVDTPGWDFCIESPGYVNKIIVAPGRPDQSFLMEKITSIRVGTCNDAHFPRMPPPPSSALTSEQIEVIRRWIAEGARPN